MSFVLASAAAGIAIGGSVMLEKYRHRRRAGTISKRPFLTEQELWLAYYASAGIAESEFAAAWRLICSTANVDAGRLRPDDDIAMFISANPWWYGAGDEWDEVLQLITARSRRSGVQMEASRFKHVDDFVQVILGDQKQLR
jgi:hypothetical protein